MQTKLLEIANILATINGCKVYHYNAQQGTKAPYIVWAEDDRIDLTAGNLHSEKAWQGTIDLYTHTEFDTLCDTVETVLGDTFAWYLSYVEYMEDTDLIHYEWVWTYA